jgi:hypothetical protein
MADLTSTEKRRFEELFGMNTGYVLNFSNRTFHEFMEEHSGINVYAPGYDSGGGSKACRMRTFWTREPNHVVGRNLSAMIDYGLEERVIRPDEFPDEARLVEECRRAAARLMQASAVDAADALTAAETKRDFAVVTPQVRDAINRNQPEAGLDRLHTFVIKFVRALCAQRGIATQREKPLHSLFGEYVKALRVAGLIESQMTERILKSSISTLEAFNDVRNNRSLAHDNAILNYDESLLIFSHIANTVRFLKALEDRATQAPSGDPEHNDDIPL